MSAIASPAVPNVGDVIAERYRVEGLLGRGGMGVVLAVSDQTTSEPLAMKLLTTAARKCDEEDATEDTDDLRERLVREARAAMRIQSRHVVRVRDVVTTSSYGPFLIMERLEGTDLERRFPRGTPVSTRVIADIAIQVCEALSLAHRSGIVHRDIKLSNVFLEQRAGEETAKVLDFGISKIHRPLAWEKTSNTLTSEGAFLGSPQFLSPEQLRSPRNVDGRADLWSLGVVMYRLVTGAFPFTGETLGEVFASILDAKPPPVSAHGVDGGDLEAIIARCLRSSVDERWPSAAALALALAPLASPRYAAAAEAFARPEVGDDAVAPARTSRLTDASRRRWFGAAFAATAMIAVAALATTAVRSRGAPDTATPVPGTSVATSGGELPPPSPAPVSTGSPTDAPAASSFVLPPSPRAKHRERRVTSAPPPSRPPSPTASGGAPPASAAASDADDARLHPNPYQR